ncbi:MAG TPA: hypothetical protein VIE16_08220 [Phenylobacterium sp.]|jgi:hypothetical protein
MAAAVASSVLAAPAASGKDAALAAGDWRRAAALGASAADVVRALQARGRAPGADPDASVVTISAQGDDVAVTPLEPLPPLPADLRNDHARTANLGGSGFQFTARPGAIILYPASAQSFESNTAR